MRKRPLLKKKTHPSELTKELGIFREGRASKEIRMLKGVVQSMEEDLLKEKNRHQRSSAKSQQEIRSLKEQVEELRHAEGDLKVRFHIRIPGTST